MINPAKPSADVFSTYVEVILHGIARSVDDASFLHVSGGDPEIESGVINNTRFSPRMWR